MFTSIRRFGTFGLSLFAALLFTATATAQVNCLIYLVPDCDGTPAISGAVLDEATCLTWLSPAGYQSVLWEPEGAAICTNVTPLAVELSSFQATTVRDGVRLEWMTSSETKNAGFEIEHRLRFGAFERIGFVAGAGTSSVERQYSHEVADLDPNLHVFRLKQIDFDGRFEYSAEIEAWVTVPGRFVLEPAYPNPFNPSTTLRFAVQAEQPVTVALFDSRGRQVGVVFDGVVPANEMQSVHIEGSRLPSGNYIVTLTGEGFSGSRSLTLVK